MKRGTLAILLIALSALLATGFFFARPYLIATSRCGDGEYTLPSDAQIYAYRYIAGNRRYAVELSRTDPDLTGNDYEALADYLETACCDPVRLNLTSYSPALVVRTDKILVNILPDKVIISLRDDETGKWNQGVRARTSDDDRLVERLSELLVKTGK